MPQLLMAAALGLACSGLIANVVPSRMDSFTASALSLCSVSGESGVAAPRVEIIASHALSNAPGQRVTVVRVSYAPGQFSAPHRHAGSVTAYITKGEVRSQLGGGPLETFKAGESFFEPPGSTHLVSANASATEPAELIAVFVAEEGAQLTTYLD
nr:cupin domain-containing protein [Bradyrhizobium tropiciagri]